jgi:hypothetical protein
MKRVMVVGAIIAGLAGCGADSEPAPPAQVEPSRTTPAEATTPAGDQDLCTLLTPADFEELAGFTVSDPAEYSYYDSPTDAYCVYGPEEGAPEVDVFVVDPADASEVYQTVLDAGPVEVEAEDVVPGTDESVYVRIGSIDGVGVALRQGGLVAALSVPSDVPDAQTKLVALAERLLERAG